MEILVAMFVLSYVIGRITVIENSVYKNTTDTFRFTFENKVVFFVILLIKIAVAYFLISVFIPDDSIKNIAIDNASNSSISISKAVYSFESRLLLAFLGTAIGGMVGIYKIKN